jgi:hydroxymethylglutaryl-CoA synthase
MPASEDVARPGVAGFGCYVPYGRVELDEFSGQWGIPPQLSRAYRLNGRNRVAVPAADEDAVTLAVTAAERCLLSTRCQAPRVGSVMMGSESHPYAVKSSSAIIAEALGLTPGVFAVDLEFACKGGSAAVMLSAAMARATPDALALAIGADCPQGAPGSLLEASVGAAAAAILVGCGTDIIATIDATASTTSDLTDFWRRDGARYPSVVGKFSVDEGYLAHSRATAERLMRETRLAPSDFAHAVFHQPYASLPGALAKSLGFRAEQLRTGLAAAKIGNSYSAACLMGLCLVLERAAPGDRILLVSFGSGAGSDGFVLTVTNEINAFRERRGATTEPLGVELGSDHADWLTYGQFAARRGTLR